MRKKHAEKLKRGKQVREKSTGQLVEVVKSFPETGRIWIRRTDGSNVFLTAADIERPV